MSSEKSLCSSREKGVDVTNKKKGGRLYRQIEQRRKGLSRRGKTYKAGVCSYIFLLPSWPKKKNKKKKTCTPARLVGQPPLIQSGHNICTFNNFDQQQHKIDERAPNHTRSVIAGKFGFNYRCQHQNIKKSFLFFRGIFSLASLPSHLCFVIRNNIDAILNHG